MDEMMKLIMMAAMDDAIKKSKTKAEEPVADDLEKEIAQANMKLFDAHIAVGFEREEAIKLVAAIIMKG